MPWVSSCWSHCASRLAARQHRPRNSSPLGAPGTTCLAATDASTLTQTSRAAPFWVQRAQRAATARAEAVFPTREVVAPTLRPDWQRSFVVAPLAGSVASIVPLANITAVRSACPRTNPVAGRAGPVTSRPWRGGEFAGTTRPRSCAGTAHPRDSVSVAKMVAAAAVTLAGAATAALVTHAGRIRRAGSGRATAAEDACAPSIGRAKRAGSE
jgi:hypothetical protein